MAKQLLDSADVVTAFEQMGRETVAQRVTTRAFDEPCFTHGPLDGALDCGLAEVVPPYRAAARISRARRGRKYILPGPLAIGTAKLTRERVRHENRPESSGEIGEMESTRVCELVAQRADQPCGQDRDPITPSLPIADHEFAALQIEILGSQPHRLHQPKPGPIHQPRRQTRDPVEARQQLHRLGARQYHRQLPRFLRSNDRSEISEFPIQDSFVEKGNRVQRLILGCGCHLSIDRQMAQECHDFRLPHLPRMPPARESDEAADPMDVRLLGPNAVVAKPNHPPRLVDEAPRSHSPLGHAHTSPATPANAGARTKLNGVMRCRLVDHGTTAPVHSGTILRQL
jgi:hypothetical protein